MMLGGFINHGQFRDVWTCDLNDQRVIKLENRDATFSNVKEWEVWQSFKDTKWAKWFAPCYAISPCGIWLVQHRTTPIEHTSQLPKKVPKFMTDLKVSNWGMIEGRVVCHDYGNNLVAENGMTNNMRAARWRT